MEGGANIGESDDECRSALLDASVAYQVEIVNFRVERGVNIAHTDRFGMPSLHWACHFGGFELAKFLVRHGAKVTDRDHGGRTALL
jgi:ankyrin repeat protein